MLSLTQVREESQPKEEPPSSGSLEENQHRMNSSFSPPERQLARSGVGGLDMNNAYHEAVVPHTMPAQEPHHFTPLPDAPQRSIPPENSLKGKILVVKLGGSTLEHQRAVLQDLIWLSAQGVHPVLIHGGGPAITSWLQAVHIPTRFERGLRVTDAQTLEVVSMVLRGQINEHLVLMAEQMGGKAVGLSGTDGNMVQAHIADEHLGLVGEIDRIDPTVVQGLINEGYLPIIAPLGLGPDGTCLNINADLVAAHLAKALHAERLVFLSNVAGISRADGTYIAALSETEAHRLIEAGVISGGMIPKVQACLDALTIISSVHIVDGGESHILLREISNTPSTGTMIVRKRAGEEEPSFARHSSPC